MPDSQQSSAARRLFLPLPTDRLAERIARCITGLALFGLGISCFITAELGLAPWDIFHQGIENKTGIPIGIVIEITGVFILLLWIPLRERMGLGTLLNAVEIGLVVFLIDDHLPDPDLMVWRVALMLLGLVCVGLGSGLYIGAGLGAGPRDGLMLGLSKRGVSVRIARTTIELTVLAVGLALGGTVGVGTVAFTFGIGPLVQFFLPRFRLEGDTTVLATAH
jgi:uncharacterized membrane protein YczE